ncbi:MAG: glucosaminidase domain-containing protein [Saprospiraceae bacterium]|nr:glucosaminidase domain-containing protein [Saprospiraceae bacterium]MDW8228804.1 glucosaminidase domain-containing protein [Saprospiraceae bacterium]
MKHTSSTNAGVGRMAHAAQVDTTQNDALIWKCLVLLALLYLVWTDRISINLNYGSAEPVARPAPVATAAAAAVLSEAAALSTPVLRASSRPEAKRTAVTLPDHATGHTRFAIDPDFARRNGCSPEEARRSLELCRAYVERLAPVAEAEMQRFGIPASITLAQGLLESNAGDSPLARKTNNHFGMKCFSKTCRRGHCVNFTDDSHKDFFIRYDNVWSSYRAHSQFLKNSKRYAALFKLDPTDYRAWAHGLQKAGYATDPLYAQKLIALIEGLGLDRYDDALMP